LALIIELCDTTLSAFCNYWQLVVEGNYKELEVRGGRAEW
jgi:hypothetical protein